MGLPDQCGGLPVSSGDTVAADDVGVAVVRGQWLADVLRDLASVHAAEAQPSE